MSSAKPYLLRAEAVNLGNFVYDTNKIQPTRGGSFLLLESVQQLDGKIVGGVKLGKITTGASIGLYRFTADESVKPEDVAKAVLEDLNLQTDGHATFVVDCLPETLPETENSFKSDLLQLHAMNRWRQYQQPTLVLPAMGAKEECAFDGVRPGIESFPGDPAPTSASVKFRADSGKKLRQTIYKKILGEEKYSEIFPTKDKDKDEDIFTDDLEELAAHKDKGNLKNKIAFIYLDGNKFTKIRTSLCDKSEKLTYFSETVENSRAKFLSKLLVKAKSDEDFKAGDKIRLETLLWGGDELEIIVPAWKGWEVLQDFFNAMKDVDFQKKPDDKDKAPLTHAGGIVFCNCKAPIREIRRMAHELSDMAKDAIKPAFKTMQEIQTKVTHKEHDTFHFLVLESFDTVGGKVKPFAQNYFGKTIWDNMRLSAEDMDKLNKAIEIMKTHGFPRNKIFDIVRAIKQNQFNQSIVDKALADNKMSKEIVDNINIFLGGKIERWFIISELWDYVCVGGAQ